MSISSIAPISSMTQFQVFGAPPSPPQSVSTMVSQLEKSISSGNLDTTQALLQSIESRSPASTGTSNPLSDFLASVATAVKDSSTTEAKTALATYQAAIAAPTKPAATTNDESVVIGKELLQDSLTLNIVTRALDTVNTTATTSNSSTSTDGVSTVFTTTSGGKAPLASSPSPSGNSTGSLYSAVA
jgi:hypothetical protein